MIWIVYEGMSRLTMDVVEDSFTRNTQFTFGHGRDHPSYVSTKRTLATSTATPINEHR
jgi:hypothetical protein